MERLQQFLANAALPTLLPTPPRCKTVPLIPTPPRCKTVPLIPTPCLVVLPISSASPSNPKPGRADSAERWDAPKKGAGGVSPPPAERRAADRARSLCRADACDRWDTNKTSPIWSSTSSSSSSSSSSSKLYGNGTSSSPSSSRGSSAERWDMNKKQSLQAGNAMTMCRTDNEVSKPQFSETEKFVRDEFAGPIIFEEKEHVK
ncbi:hypothetical protein GUJ93_ZPchr0010g9602 [Zizania palustris]|uniref:Uncharacterized protein n=1 Tax=Zizania palustris TaxID=103762 RepID=A0A8J5W966_ZIZPA|nr:hypothetical protein GUJ93_ZPchr0010g9602 [Zizania palustris]